MQNRIVALFSVLLLAAGCQAPFSEERFIAAPGPYEFQANLSDSTATYDFAFYTRLDGMPSELASARELPLRVTWTSPSDSVFTENVYMPLEGRSLLFSRQVYQVYRTGVRPVEPGVWKLSVTVPYSGGREVLRGLGLEITTNL